MVTVILLGCGINTWKVYVRTTMSGSEDFVVCFAAILMTMIGVTTLSYVGRECLVTGPVGLVKTILVHKRKVHIAPIEIDVGLIQTC